MDLKEILSYQGIELKEDATLDEYKKAFDGVFVRLDQAAEHPDVKKANVGEATRKYATELKRTAKEHGIDLTKEDTDLPVDELARLVASKIQEGNTSIIEDLKSKAGKPSEALEKLTGDYEKLKLKYEDEARVKGELAEKLTESEKKFGTFQKDFKLNDNKKSLLSKLPFSDTANELVKDGFISRMEKEYKIDLDETGSVYITDIEGKRISDPSKHGSYLSAEDVYSMKMKEYKIAKEVDTTKVNQPPTPTAAPIVNREGVRQSRPRMNA
tara:strand:- start:6410 stop:7219 length:810 start_codon:yes stop_codon:yes gene_type:complete